MRLKIFTLFASALMIAASASIADADLTRDQRISDARAVIGLYENQYAPAVWKKDYLGIELDAVMAKLLGEAYREDSTDEDFYAAIAHVVGTLKDTHNWLIIPSTYSAYLGFSCDYVDGRYLIDYVSRSLLPQDSFPYFRGDEIISIDGVPVQDVIAELSTYTSHGSEMAEKRFLAGDLAYRSQRTYPHIPTGMSSVEIYSQMSGETGTANVKWHEYGKPLVHAKDGSTVSGVETASASSASGEMGGVSKDGIPMDLDHLRWSAFEEVRAIEAGIGSMQPFFPLWDSFEVRNEYPLLTGTFKVDGHRIGFIRIPTWWPSNANPWFDLLDREIPYFENKTDALVIDETNNGGGSLCLANEISRYFVTQPIKALLFQIRANRTRLMNYESWAEWCDSQSEKPDYCPFVKIINDELRRAIADGDSLTKPLSLCVDDGLIHPMATKSGRQIVYTKPIVILTNEWSISAADMFPAPLQDSGRAVIFGERTCGAGGSVMTLDNIGYSDFQVSQTLTIAVRPKKVMSPEGIETQYLENVGVAPDIQYSITFDDFVGGYEGYKGALDDAIRGLVK